MSLWIIHLLASSGEHWYDIHSNKSDAIKAIRNFTLNDDYVPVDNIEKEMDLNFAGTPTARLENEGTNYYIGA